MAVEDEPCPEEKHVGPDAKLMVLLVELCRECPRRKKGSWTAEGSPAKLVKICRDKFCFKRLRLCFSNGGQRWQKGQLSPVVQPSL